MGCIVLRSLSLLALTTATAWPLDGVTSRSPRPNSLTPRALSVEEWFSFRAGSPHCDLRHRIEFVGTSGVITVTDPAADTYTTTTLSNSSYLKKTCTVTGPAPISDGKCINSLTAAGALFEFSGVEACPRVSSGVSSASCDVWINKGRASSNVSTTFAFYFVSGTNKAVRYLTNTTTAAGSYQAILDYTQWSANVPVPTSAWDTPADWQPCTKSTPSSSMLPTEAAPAVY